MTELKTHKGTMTAKLRCGGMVECELVEENGSIGSGSIEWYLDGRYYSSQETPIDIVEIVSEPSRANLLELFTTGELKDGMVFINDTYELQIIQMRITSRDQFMGLLRTKGMIQVALWRICDIPFKVKFILREELTQD